MTAFLVPRPRLLPSALATALGLWTSVALGQAPVDDGAADGPAPEKLPAYHGTAFAWEHEVSAETIGVGDDVQSSNPAYTMGLSAHPRWYLLDEPGNTLSVRADAAVYREFTNSDNTTRRGELAPIDTELMLVYVRRIQGPADTDGTLLDLRPLSVVLPTSRSSWDSGRYFAPGVTVGITRTSPLLTGRVQPALSMLARAAVGYKRWFARATVPTNPSLERVRLGPDGRSSVTDQLSGSSLVRDELTFSGRLQLALADVVTWTTEVGFQPAWKYDVDDEVELCGVVATGCTTVPVSQDDNRYLLTTRFSTELSFDLTHGFSVEVGYGHTTSQLGPDGRRRGFFYSPDAGFFASLSFTPDALATPPKTKSAQAERASGSN